MPLENINSKGSGQDASEDVEKLQQKVNNISHETATELARDWIGPSWFCGIIIRMRIAKIIFYIYSFFNNSDQISYSSRRPKVLE